MLRTAICSVVQTVTGCQSRDSTDTRFITLKHNQQCRLISMCRPIHMSIKRRNQAAEQTHGKKCWLTSLFNLPSSLHSLWAVVFDYLVRSITAWYERGFYANEICGAGDRNTKHLVECWNVRCVVNGKDRELYTASYPSPPISNQFWCLEQTSIFLSFTFEIKNLLYVLVLYVFLIYIYI